jgi:hypothetical protein
VRAEPLRHGAFEAKLPALRYGRLLAILRSTWRAIGLATPCGSRLARPGIIAVELNQVERIHKHTRKGMLHLRETSLKPGKSDLKAG